MTFVFYVNACDDIQVAEATPLLGSSSTDDVLDTTLDGHVTNVPLVSPVAPAQLYTLIEYSGVTVSQCAWLQYDRLSGKSAQLCVLPKMMHMAWS